DLDTLGILEASLPVRGDDIPSGPSRAITHWATAEIARLERILTNTVGKLASVKASSIYDLWQRVERDPAILDRLAADISADIAVARMQLHALQRELEDRRKARVSSVARRGTGD